MGIDLKSEPPFTLGHLTVMPPGCRVQGPFGERVLQPKVMQVLVALARAQGAVITRDQLLARVWNGVVVGEDAITRAVGQIRRLSEWDRGRSFELRTVPTIGYALVAGASADTGADEPLLAVLPFDNLSDEAELRFLADGLAEEVLHTLARRAAIRLIGRSSSFQFRGDRKSTALVKRDLRATHMLDGSIRRIGSQVRVAAHLTETATQTLVWSDRFDCDPGEIFALQEQIAGLVTTALNRTFARRLRPHDVDPVAYDLYLRGAELCRDIVPESQRQAIALLEAATRRWPDFADAWGELALARAQSGFLRFERLGTGRDLLRAEAEADAARARALDPDCPAAQLLPFVGGALFRFEHHQRQFAEPRRSKLATAASPNISLGVQLLEVGRVAEALEHFRQAEQFDPLFQILIFYRAHAQSAVGDHEGAIRRLDAAIARWPRIPFFTAARIVWAALAEDWPLVEAMTDPRRLEHYPLHHRAGEVAAIVEACRARDASSDGLERLREQAFAIGKSGLEPILLHARWAGLGQTLAMIERRGGAAVDADAPRRPDDPGPISLFLPAFANVRRDPHFPTLCARLGLVSHWQASGVWPTCADEFPAGEFQTACEDAQASV